MRSPAEIETPDVRIVAQHRARPFPADAPHRQHVRAPAERQRLPRVLLDEPGAGVNPTLMRALASALLALRAQGRTFLLIEHDMDLVTELCDPVIVMAQGRKLMEGPFAAVRRDPRVLEAYLGQAS